MTVAAGVTSTALVVAEVEVAMAPPAVATSDSEVGKEKAPAAAAATEATKVEAAVGAMLAAGLNKLKVTIQAANECVR